MPMSPHGPDHGEARGFGVGHGVEAHENVRQSGSAENQGDAEREKVERAVGGFIAQTRREEIFHDFGAVWRVVMNLADGGEKSAEAEAEMREDQKAEKNRAGDQQNGFDDLHPSGGDHAAKDDVNDHQDSHAGDGEAEADARTFQQQGDQRSGADHLRDHVERADGDGAERGHGANRARMQAVGENVCHGVLAGVAQRFGDDEQDGEVGD